ncbi:MAG: sulfatase-like hydrolase/transferase [Gammaproteobacteria bacterium]|nr:sulfatase-like hydrolase/transferase [Gammaproteobacteria bacterium]
MAQLAILVFVTALPQYWLKFSGGVELSEKSAYITEQLLSSPALLGDILQYIAVQIGALVALVIFIWLLTRACSYCFHVVRSHERFVGFLLYFCVAMLIFTENAVRFPSSTYAYILTDTYGTEVALMLRNILLFAFAVLLVALVTTVAKRALGNLALRSARTVGGGVVALLVLLMTMGIPATSAIYSSRDVRYDTDRPNIFIIGIDSVSSLHVTRDGEQMPFITNFLKQASYFDHALTPLARTFPAWTTILTGDHPKSHGARFNLYDFNRIKLSHTLPKVLQANGYTTVFAMDERRFSNIDESYGFDHTIGPKVGAADFLLPTLSDMPVTNLLVDSPLGYWLFPQLTLNAAAYTTYEPDRFVDYMLDQLKSFGPEPKFVASHFCLAHFPFQWRDHQRYRSRVDTASDAPNALARRHAAALLRVDEQVKSYIEGLADQGLLENAIVVFLSDHGEGTGDDGDLNLREERYAGRSSEKHTAISAWIHNTQQGHGANTLNAAQYRSILAIRTFGLEGNASVAQTVHTPVSLMDVMPTLLDLMDISPSNAMDGLSLANIVREKNSTSAPASRSLFLETGVEFSAVLDLSNFDPARLLAESISYYEVVPASGRLQLKPEKTQKLIKYKQRSIIRGHWQLTLLTNQGKFIQPVLVNLDTKSWTYDFESPLAQQAPLAALRGELIGFYGDEIDTENICDSRATLDLPCLFPVVNPTLSDSS